MSYPLFSGGFSGFGSPLRNVNRNFNGGGSHRGGVSSNEKPPPPLLPYTESATPTGQQAVNGAPSAPLAPEDLSRAWEASQPGHYRKHREGPHVVSWDGLDLSKAGFLCIPLVVGDFVHITSLDVSHNKVEHIANGSLRSLIHLTSLDLSYNHLLELPNEIGWLPNLESLFIQENYISELPLTLGHLCGRLKTLESHGNPFITPPPSILSRPLDEQLLFLREQLGLEFAVRPDLPPQRQWTSLPAVTTSGHVHRILSYNILAESYASEQMYPYCPSQALDWGYRQQQLLNEITEHNPDILCLQEVELKVFEKVFAPSLSKSGYQGVFKAKTRAITMDEARRQKVDGVAIFVRRSRYAIVETKEVDYSQKAMSHQEFLDDKDSLTRLMTRDNVALIAVLLELGDKRPIIVSNTHLHWDPAVSDVKLMQAQFLCEEIEEVWRNTGSASAVCVCGDFNSEPDSAVYQLMTTGHVPGNHPDVLGSRFGDYTASGFRTSLRLVSAVQVPYTNYTRDFVGVLDYIFVSERRMKPLRALNVLPRDTIRRQMARPGVHAPSDHFAMVCEVADV